MQGATQLVACGEIRLLDGPLGTGSLAFEVGALDAAAAVMAHA